MATLFKEFFVTADAATAWDAVRDFGALHTRLVPGFVTACELGADNMRSITFANGMQAREQLLGCDDAARRLAYTVVGGRAAYHHASVQVIAQDGGSRMVWTTDVLPDAIAAPIGGMMDLGVAAMKRALGSNEA